MITWCAGYLREMSALQAPSFPKGHPTIQSYKGILDTSEIIGVVGHVHVGVRSIKLLLMNTH